MHLILTLETHFDAPPTALWAHLTDIATMVGFTGYGPIPGIEGAVWLADSGARLGAIRRVHNLDGSAHFEELVRFEPERHIEDRIYDFDAPVRLLVREIRDSFRLADECGGTALFRQVTFELRSPLLLPLAWLMRDLFRRAARRHHANIAQHIG